MPKIKKDIVALADALHSAAIHLLRHVRSQDRDSGIGPAQLSALSVLVFGGSMSLRRLAAIEQVKPPTMVRIVRGLVERGLVVTCADASDARKISISATRRGRSLMQRARNRRVQALANMLAQRSKAELQHLRRAGDVLRSLTDIDNRPR
ncbi:MAG: MarR family transcriptional regulator [Candidatus Korobacteraceae bacterium]